jgi:putative transposase
MLLTTSIKLLANKEQKAKLLKSMYVFNQACNWASEYAFQHKIYSKVILQQDIYYELRKKFNLPAQFAIRIISRVAETYKLDKKIQHKFNKTSSVEYDQRILNWQKLDKISILSVDGRLKNLPIVFGQYAKLNERVIRNSAKLIYKNKEFYLQAVVEVPEESLQEIQDFLGVDLGIVNIATRSDNINYSSEATEKVRLKTNKLKKNLQKTGTKSAKKHLQKISTRERNFKKNTNHIISKQIVAEAKRHNKAISVEDLYNFKKTVRKDQREQFGKWAFRELADFIIYKAKIAGVAVIKVDPRNTSRTCSNCGHCDKANRKTQSLFECKACNFSINADHNAATNIKNLAKNQYLLLQNFTKLISWAVVNQPIVAVKTRPPTQIGQATSSADLSRSY